jgi:hypothetical protein
VVPRILEEIIPLPILLEPIYPLVSIHKCGEFYFKVHHLR